MFRLLAVLLTAAFVILKLVAGLPWSWLAVASPLLIYFGFVVFLGVVMIAGVRASDRWLQREFDVIPPRVRWQ